MTTSSRLSSAPSGASETVKTIPDWSVGDRLKKALDHAGISVQAAADYLGVGVATVGRWTNDRTSPPSRMVYISWEAMTGVDAEWLETGLPRLDSNQQPSGYPLALVSDLAEVIDLAERRAS